MLILIPGLLLFIGIHSLRLIAPSQRESMIGRLGAGTWKGLYSVVSLIALAMIIHGYSLTRLNPVVVFTPDVWTRHMALLFTWLAFILLAAGFIPHNHLKARLGHPMYAGIKIWAFAHLLANGRLGDLLLFGTFMVWAIAGFSFRRRQDRRLQIIAPAGNMQGTLITLVAGSIAWGIFALWLHVWMIGVYPLPF